MNNIRLFCDKDVKAISDFQIKMAKETEALQLIPQLVMQGIEYLLTNNSQGFFIVSTDQQDHAIGSLLLTFQNQTNWWIQSVFVVEEHRRKGVFTRMFNEAIRIAKEKNVKKVGLYANIQNQRAIQTYYKLGMKSTGEYLYGYDLIYGHKEGIEFLKNKDERFYVLESEETQIENSFEGVERVFGEKNKNKMLKIFQKEGDMLCGRCQYFREFSDWRFSLIFYWNYVEARKGYEKQVLDCAMQYIYSSSQLKVSVLRVLVKKEELEMIKKIWPGLYDEKYQVIAITL